LIKHQHISYLVTISFILMTHTFDQLVILQGEIRCLSLLGLKGWNWYTQQLSYLALKCMQALCLLLSLLTYRNTIRAWHTKCWLCLPFLPAKILGVTVTDDLKWNAHVNNIVLKASKRLYLLRLLKRADLDVKSLIQFYCTCIRSILEYACQTFHSSLPQYLSDDIERIQKRALRIIFPDLHYNEALESAQLTTLCARREELCVKLFSSIEEDSQHKLRHLLPEPNTSCYNFRTARKYQLPQINTKR